MLVRPCVLNVPGEDGELSPSGYSLHQGWPLFLHGGHFEKVAFFGGPYVFMGVEAGRDV